MKIRFSVHSCLCTQQGGKSQRKNINTLTILFDSASYKQKFSIEMLEILTNTESDNKDCDTEISFIISDSHN
jgi:hypothetical protein